MDTKTRFNKINLAADSTAAKRDPFNIKQSLHTPIIPQYLCQVLAELGFKRSWYNVFQSNTSTKFSPYKYIHVQEVPATLIEVVSKQ